jgi:hypothetical protein
MKISEVLEQGTVTVDNGDFLASITRSEGYLPTFKDTQSLAKGQYLYKIVGVGAPDGVTGKYASHKVVPMVISEDQKSFVEDANQPIIIQEEGKITYVTGRNHPDFKDGYQDRQVRTMDVAAGEEHRNLLLAFIEFVNSEYSLGVNDFTLEGPEFTAGA